MQYLSENGMGKAELILPEAMLGYWPAINLEHRLDRMFRQIAMLDFAELCPGLPAIGHDFAPTYNKTRWGRLGIDMFRTWNMGVFAGVMMNNIDHHLWPLDVEKGPDLVIFLESEYSKTDAKKRSVYEGNIHSEGYIRMISELTSDHGRFDFQPGIKESPWRIAVLRMSLYDVLYGKYSQKEQTEAVKDAIVEGINMILKAMGKA